MRKYATAAQVLRMLAGSDEPVTLDGSADPFRFIFLTAAEACEQLTAAREAQDRAHTSVIAVRDLLARVADALDAQPPPAEGGTWALFSIAQEVRRVLNQSRAVALEVGQRNYTATDQTTDVARGVAQIAMPGVGTRGSTDSRRLTPNDVIDTQQER